MDLLLLIAIVVVVGGVAVWLIRLFETPQPLAKLLIAAVVILLGLYFLNGIGFAVPNVLRR